MAEIKLKYDNIHNLKQKIMYRISSFENAQQFSELFGLTTHGNGVTSRKNKILLQLYKSKRVWDYCRQRDDWRLLGIKSMGQLMNFIMLLVSTECRKKSTLYEGKDYPFTLNGHFFSSPKYLADNDGICLDGTSAEAGFIRYRNMERDQRVFKMSAGKFFKHCILTTEIGNAIPEQVLVWVLEQLVEGWRSYVADIYPEYELHVNRNFDRIYDSNYLAGDFGSCMVDEGNEGFYYDAVEAKAAYLENSDGKIVARCIIYTNVTDQDGKKWRLAERQYSSECSDLLKHHLVDALIKGDYIDGYKQVGAGCGDSRSFVDNNGNSLYEKKFKTPCRLERNDRVSYQDSFKTYCMSNNMAYNYFPSGEVSGDLFELDVTRGYFDGGGEYDDYHDQYVDSVTEVVYHGRYINCDSDDLEDFTWYDGQYRHTDDDLIECERCGEYALNPDYYRRSDAVYSDLTGEWYCCEDCKDDAEEDWKSEYWHWSYIDECYVEDEDDLSKVLIWDVWQKRYVLGTVITENISKHLIYGNLAIHNGVIADDITKMLQDDKVCEELARMNKELVTA